jgi:Fur family iron response transcriptional regulator
MTRERASELLRQHGIQPSPQRVAVAEYVLASEEHPSADRVFAEVRARLPAISRATVYNTLNRLVAQGLLKQLLLAEGKVVFDPKTAPHHHFVDDASGEIHDVPWEALEVRRVDALPGVEVREYQVVLRGRARPGAARAVREPPEAERSSSRAAQAAGKAKRSR